MKSNAEMREHLAKVFIDRRKAKGLTAQKIADAIGMNLKAYAAYEERRAEPPIRTLLKLAKFYGITIDELVSLNEC